MRAWQKAIGGALIACTCIGACDGAWVYLISRSGARYRKSANEFMVHLYGEDWTWIGRRLEGSSVKTVGRLEELRAENGPIRSWSIDHWYGYPIPDAGRVAIGVTRGRAYETPIG